MRQSRKPELTVAEIIAVLQHSSINNIVVEGPEDMVAFRPLDEITGVGLTSLISASGRSNVLELYRRRNELPPSARVIFVADKDTWIMGSVPLTYLDPNLVFTDGYSIENDVIRDASVLSFMTQGERAIFDLELEIFCRWYAIVIRRRILTKSDAIDDHPDKLFSDPSVQASMMQLHVNERFPSNICLGISQQFQRVIRGKSLMALIMRQLNKGGRRPKHNSLAIFQMVSRNPGAYVSRIFKDVEIRLRQQSSQAVSAKSQMRTTISPTP